MNEVQSVTTTMQNNFPPLTEVNPSTIKHRLKIKHDDCAESPREWDNLGTMFCRHGRYNLGDKNADDIRDEDNRLPRTGYTILPLFLYDHGGITMNTTGFSCPWDSGLVGIIYVSDEKARKEYGWKRITAARREQLRTYLKGEVEVYDQYITGDVYGFTYEQVSVDQHGVETVIEEDSCWGFYGSDPKKNGMADYLSVDVDDCEVIRG